MQRHTDQDPLALALKPPPDETMEARVARLQKEEEAKRVSQEIDECIRRDRQTLKKTAKSVVRILLLGQSESGMHLACF
jgi:guanine nucleotide-binding protein alpha-1 subunit